MIDCAEQKPRQVKTGKQAIQGPRPGGSLLPVFQGEKLHLSKGITRKAGPGPWGRGSLEECLARVAHSSGAEATGLGSGM